MNDTTTYAQQPALRNGELQQIVDMLTAQRARALDVVAPARTLSAQNGGLWVKGGEAILSADGVTTVDGRYDLVRSADGQLADMLGIPGQYARRMHADHVDLWDANVNGWLEREPDRLFLLRALRGTTDAPALVRAVLSPNYRIVDSFDVLMATLEGIEASGAEVSIDGADLTERRMYVRVSAPGVSALAPNLLAGYHSPFTGATPAQRAGMIQHGYHAPGTEPVVWAGFVVRDSDTGHGAASLTPRLVVQACTNGLTLTTDDTERMVHLGSRMEAGVVKVSGETQQANLALIRGMAKDAVRTFLSPEYVEAKVRELEAAAGVPLSNPLEQIQVVAKKLNYTDAQVAGILDHFVKGGQGNLAGGLLNAVTSYAQTVEDADVASDLERTAVKAMEMVATLV
jgi:hypothetical protein